jgi:hypothetical protein
MAKTILEDISGFLAEKNSEFLNFKTDIDQIKTITDENTIYLLNDLNKLEIELSNSNIYKQLLLDNQSEDFSNKIKDLFVNIENLKKFLLKSKAELIVQDKKLITDIQKVINWIVKELTGAAEDRVDIRQELGYEITKRREQDSNLNKKIEAEIVDRLDKQTVLKQDIEAQIALTNSTISETNLNLTTEITNRTNAITTLTNDLTTESELRISADSAIDNKVLALSNELIQETALRTSNDLTLKNLITQLETNLKEIITENETRRISDLGILTARDNLEEELSKKRDYNTLDEIRDIYSDAPLKSYSLGTNDYDHLATSTDTINNTSTTTSAGKTKHGILGNLIRKVNTLGKKLQGKTNDVYDDDSWSDTNSQVGLDYWVGSLYKFASGILSIRSSTTVTDYINVLDANHSTKELKIGEGFNIVNFLGGIFKIDKSVSTDKKITIDVKTISATAVDAVTFNSATTVVTAKTFQGEATSALYADLAERYEADKIYNEGTVLGIGGNKEVTLYQYGMPLAGVVSKFPAFRMNDRFKQDSEHDLINPFLALKGRIPVKFNGAIKKGNYIIADTDGKARAYIGNGISTNLIPYIIGIALHDANQETHEFVEVKV